jgi:hypothetical protein
MEGQPTALTFYCQATKYAEDTAGKRALAQCLAGMDLEDLGGFSRDDLMKYVEKKGGADGQVPRWLEQMDACGRRLATYLYGSDAAESATPNETESPPKCPALPNLLKRRMTSNGDEVVAEFLCQFDEKEEPIWQSIHQLLATYTANANALRSLVETFESLHRSSFKVAAIVDQRIEKDGKSLYRVEWVGYPSFFDSWEPATNIGSTFSVLYSEYLERRDAEYRQYLSFVVSPPQRPKRRNTGKARVAVAKPAKRQRRTKDQSVVAETPNVQSDWCKCQVCDKDVESRLYTSHMHTVHLFLEASVVCAVCQESVSRRYLKRHQLQRHGLFLGQPCFQCHLLFASLNLLRLHLMDAHPNTYEANPLDTGDLLSDEDYEQSFLKKFFKPLYVE